MYKIWHFDHKSYKVLEEKNDATHITNEKYHSNLIKLLLANHRHTHGNPF